MELAQVIETRVGDTIDFLRLKEREREKDQE